MKRKHHFVLIIIFSFCDLELRNKGATLRTVFERCQTGSFTADKQTIHFSINWSRSCFQQQSEWITSSLRSSQSSVDKSVSDFRWHDTSALRYSGLFWASKAEMKAVATSWIDFFKLQLQSALSRHWSDAAAAAASTRLQPAPPQVNTTMMILFVPSVD